MELSRTWADRVESLSRRRSAMRRLPTCKAETERALCYRWRNHHDISAAHQLVGNYLYLAEKIAEGYGSCGVSLQDLIGEGYVGLTRAVCRFDPDRGVPFTGYATWCVREAIHEYMLQTRRTPLCLIASLSATQLRAMPSRPAPAT
jgi:RNA polymerase sigma-32 factor